MTKPYTMKLHSGIILLLASTNFVFAQQGKDSVTSAGSHFKVSGSRSAWMGSNYRKEWNMPVKARVIDLSTEKGGLTPVKRGGGKQTRSLRLEDAKGREYSLRSIQKFITSKTLPGDLQSEAAADLVQDGVSASYPYANLSLPVLAKAAGVPHSYSELVYIPDDPKLGEFREDFANMLAFLETRVPDSVKKDFSTDEVVEKLKDDNDNEVDQLALLRARILDMYVMDLDRHEDQWKWGAIDKNNGKIYYPIARDKDQAFYINEGLIPGIGSWPWLVPQIEGFKVQSRNIKRFNWAARNLDRFFLNKLSEDDWKQAADKFVSQMTDEVIQEAMDAQPDEIKGLRWNEILTKLKERRKYLVDEVMEYYRFLSEDVDIFGSDKNELFDITRHDDGSVSVKVYKITKEGEQSHVMYDRKFDPAVTKELRLYGFGNDDKFVINGNNDKIKIRMIGGSGEDEFNNTASSGKAIVYDDAGKDNKLTGPLKNKLSRDSTANSYDRLGYKYNQVIPFISANYNRDDGLFLGVSLKVIRHGFRKDPYKNMHEFAVNHALSTNAWNFRFYSEYISTFGRTCDLLFDADIKAPNNTTNFFGYGPNSTYNKNQPGKFRYYRARYQLGDVSLLLRKRFSDKFYMTIGPTFQFFSLNQNDKFNSIRFITDIGNNGLDPNTLYMKQSYFGGKLSLVADTRDNKALTRKGITWTANLRHLAGQNNASYDVTQFDSEFAFYLPLSKGIVLANRFGGGHNFGDYEFYQAQYLGSEDNLRGYRKYRFAGDSKLFNNLELRMKVANFNTYLFPGSMGFLFFFDAGRVWADANSSNKWATGYGGGLWFSPLSRMVISFAYTASKEDQLPLIGVGWKF